jgi:polygalacturonase
MNRREMLKGLAAVAVAGLLPTFPAKAALPFGLVGDGVADDTAAMQAFIDNAAASGAKTINMPAGTFRVSRTIMFHGQGTLFVGHDEGTTFSRNPHSGPTVMLMG